MPDVRSRPDRAIAGAPMATFIVTTKDDLVDSGVTLSRVVDHLKQRFAAITEVRTAVLWYKACSAFRPDYYVEYLPTNPWIHQPFEVYDAMGPQKLAARVRSGATG